jgi:hypothetical protein
MDNFSESKADNLPIVKQFAHSFAHFDTAGISKLMAPKGEFIIQDQDGEDLLVEDRADYLSWLQNRFADYREDSLAKKKLKYEFDTCNGCSAGCPVLYFEGAIFPRISEDPEEVLMHGLMVDIKQGKIQRILFCYNFKYLERYA